MGSLLFYLFQSSLCLGLLYFLFRLFFRADTLFRTNRVLLLAGAVCCVLLPLVPCHVTAIRPLQHPVSVVRSLLIPEEEEEEEEVASNMKAKNTPIVAIASHQASEEEGDATDIHHQPPQSVSWSEVLGTLYLSGVGITLLFFSLSTWRMWMLIHRYPRRKYKQYRLIVCPEKIASFSWGNIIVLSQEDYGQHATEILLHEEMHLRCRHTLDLIGMELLIVAHWFNPAAWLLMRELREIHEYEADYGVLAHGIDATQYQLLLVKKSVGTRLYSMASGLTHSKLKKRINMMLRKRTDSRARLKLLLFVPVAAATLMAFAQPEVKQTVEQMMKPESVKQTTIPPEEWELLEQFFARKKKEALGENGKGSAKKEEIHSFFVNMKNQVLVDYEGNKSTDWEENADFIRTKLSDTLKKGYEKAIKNNSPFRPELIVRYDHGTQMAAMKIYLNAIKEVYQQLRSEVNADKGLSEAELDAVFPIIVSLPKYDEMKTFGDKPFQGDEVPLPVEIQFFSNSGTASKLLKNISLKELKEEIMAYKASAGGNEAFTVNFKVTSNDVMMGTVMAIKETIRKAYYGQ